MGASDVRGTIRWLAVAVLVGVLATPTAASEVLLPPGFTSRVHVTGEGFDRGSPGAAGVPVVLTLGVDPSGILYLARTGNRYSTGETEELLTRLYRIPPAGARITPATEPGYLHGPPLRNPEVGAVPDSGVLLLTTYDPDRQLGVLYRMLDGRPALLAGGTPPAGRPAVLQQPEGVAVDAGGNVYVADRARGAVVKLDRQGRLVEAAYARVPRARTVAVDAAGQLWVGGDGTATQPWQEGQGQIWRVAPDGRATLAFEGPHAAAVAAAPAGGLFVAQRHTRRVFLLTAEGRRVEFATLGGEAMPRGLAFAPDTPETRRAGIAGDLFVVSFTLRTWYLNEVIRISGPFADFVRRGSGLVE
jgi:DNA-binding beta-propeller fold protein YncE